MNIVVSDTTPLNYLILIECVEVIPQLFGKLLIPPAVVSELRHPKAPASVRAWAGNLPAWVEIRAPKINVELKIGRGESEAISLAMEFTDVAILVDDRKAKCEAEIRGLITIGTLTILDFADGGGLLEFEEAISRLLKTNFHVEEAVIAPLSAKVRARKRV